MVLDLVNNNNNPGGNNKLKHNALSWDITQCACTSHCALL